MFKSFAFLNGILIGVMVFVNGILSLNIGLISSTILIHIIGISFVSILLAIRKKKLNFIKNLKYYYIFPGFVGVFTVIFQNYSYQEMVATVTLTAALFGQLIFSSIVDHFGLFGLKKFKFNIKKLPAYLLIIFGIIIMAI
jgi:transporter family-2 protein